MSHLVGNPEDWYSAIATCGSFDFNGHPVSYCLTCVTYIVIIVAALIAAKHWDILPQFTTMAICTLQPYGQFNHFPFTM